MANATLKGKAAAGNPHVRFYEGDISSEKTRSGSLLNRLALFSASVAFAITASARTPFPHVDGNYDISDPSAWGVETIPWDEMTFTDKTAVYTNSREVTFKSVLQTQSAGQDIVFRMSPSWFVTVNGSFSPYYANTKQTFDGGKWSVGTLVAVKKDGTLVLTNGVVVNATTFQMGGSSGGKMTVTDSSELHFKRGDNFGSAVNTVLTVSDGAQMTWNDGYFQPWGVNSTNNLFLVTGTDSTANCENKSTTVKIADKNSTQNTLRVEKGATMWVGSGAFGQDAGAVSNRIEVVDAGSKLEFKGALKVNNVVGARANDILVADGGEIALTTANVADFSMAGGGYSTVFVSNATFRANKIGIGTEATSRWNLFRVYGKNSILDTPLRADSFFSIFGAGGNNRFELDNANWSSPLGQVGTGYAYGSESCSNTVAVLNGSSVSLPYFSLGYNAGTGDDNVLLVTGGSTFSVNFASATSADINALVVSGAGNMIVVSNATVTADGTNACISIGYLAPAATTIGTGNGIVLQGATPRVTATNGTIRAQNASKFVFEIPVGGYETVPLEAKTITLANDTEIDVSCDAFQKALRKSTSVVLARASVYGIHVADAVAAANERLLPLRRQLVVDGTDLVLKVRSAKQGLCVVVR